MTTAAGCAYAPDSREPDQQTEMAGRVAGVDLARRNTGSALGDWARRATSGVSGTVFVAWTRDRHRMRFARNGASHAKRSWRTHWISPALTEAKRTRPPASHRRRCGLENGYVGVDPTGSLAHATPICVLRIWHGCWG